MTESNLARSLFSGKQALPLRKKTSLVSEEPDAADLCPQEPEQVSQDLRIDLRIEQLEAELRALNATRDERLLEQELLTLQLEEQLEQQTETFEQQKEQLQDYREQIERQNEAFAQQKEQIAQQKELIEQQKEEIESRKEAFEQQKQQLAKQQEELTIECLQLQQNLEAAMQELNDGRDALQRSQNEVALITQHKQELELEVTHGVSAQARLQQALLSVQQDYAIARDRLLEMEQLVAELQEQVLKQVGQTAEYEAAIQHWKDRALMHQRHALQLSGALDRVLDDREGMQKAANVRPQEQEHPPVLAVVATAEKPPTALRVDLPAFLTRTR